MAPFINFLELKSEFAKQLTQGKKEKFQMTQSSAPPLAMNMNKLSGNIGSKGKMVMEYMAQRVKPAESTSLCRWF